MADHDHILLHMEYMGKQRIFLEDLEALTWPPPGRLYMDEDSHLLREFVEGDDELFIFRRVRMSELTDEQAESMSGVARGAEYRYEKDCGN